MNDVAGQDDEAGILEMDQQRLVAGGVPWRVNQSDASIAEYIGITVDELKVLRRAQELTRQRHQLIYVVVRPVGGMYPAVAEDQRRTTQGLAPTKQNQIGLKIISTLRACARGGAFPRGSSQPP